MKLAEVNFGCDGGLSEIAIRSTGKRPLIDGVSRLRFVFQSGPLGFNVYREIAVYDRPQF